MKVENLKVLRSTKVSIKGLMEIDGKKLGFFKSVKTGNIKIISTDGMSEDEFISKTSVYYVSASESMKEAIDKALTAHSSPARGDELLNKVLKYAFKKHILIEGEKGVGKTYTISKFLHEEKINTVFIGGHEGMEASDMLGHFILNAKGELVWKDGALSQAFRQAQKQPTVLFFDELLRVPAKELNLLVSSLTPNGNNEYVLKTSRAVGEIDAIAQEEEIRVPVNNLWVIATTNIGAGYQVEEMDEALTDRFRTVIKKSTDSEIRKILLTKTKDKNLVTQMIDFYKFMKKTQEDGDLNRVINLRHLVEAIDLSDGTKNGVIDCLVDIIPQWVDRKSNGELNETQATKVKKLLKEAFEM